MLTFLFAYGMCDGAGCQVDINLTQDRNVLNSFTKILALPPLIHIMGVGFIRSYSPVTPLVFP